jgi:hypothetical protein
VGRRGWNRGVGLLAALGLTLLPEAVIWSSRARFYGLLQLLVLLLLWLTWEWLHAAPKQESPRRPWVIALLWALLVALALFTQEQTLLLLPGLLLAMLLWKGLRWMAAPPQLVAFALVALAAFARYLLEIRGQPGYFETIQSTRPYVGLVFDLRGAWTTYSPLFVGAARLPWTLGAFGALALALAAWWPGRSLRTLPAWAQSTLFYGLQLALPLAAIFLLVGTTWRDTRYLFFLQPIVLLLGAAGRPSSFWCVLRSTAGCGRWPPACCLARGSPF